jgi:hypothetical protein
MPTTKSVGLSLGGAVLAGAVASCPVAQAAVLGIFGALGIAPFAAHLRPMLYAVAMLCGALTIYSAIRIWRRSPGHASS